TLTDCIKSALNQSCISVLDIGCGNGRFLSWLTTKENTISRYVGIDTNETLLLEANQDMQDTNYSLELQKKDIVAMLVDEASLGVGEKYDVVALFGIMHHIPSFELRKQLLTEAFTHLLPGGIMVVSFWQFARFERFQNKLITPEQASFRKSELEEHDYFLGWGDEGAVRYAHWVGENETSELTRDIPHSKVVKTWYADGKNEKLNYYVVLQKQR
ncbi:class I SAM-dependent methyltransferase, partial [Candidatus Woesebacteria bacterium]|nr:class I SAM-dependent methyltransferase [Candidatus Woesebacteria bacterium]